MLGEPGCGPEPSCTSPTAAQVLEQDSNATSMTISSQEEHKLQNQCFHTWTFPSPSEASVALILASIRKYRGCPKHSSCWRFKSTNCGGTERTAERICSIWSWQSLHWQASSSSCGITPQFWPPKVTVWKGRRCWDFLTWIGLPQERGKKEKGLYIYICKYIYKICLLMCSVHDLLGNYYNWCFAVVGYYCIQAAKASTKSIKEKRKLSNTTDSRLWRSLN